MVVEGANFIVFDSTTRLVEWSQADSTDQGEYKIEINARITGVEKCSQSAQFWLTVEMICSLTETVIEIEAPIVPQ